MVKIGMLLPEERMVEPARKIIEENHLDVVYLEAVHTVDAVNKARIAVEAGAHILVARGYQAKLIKEYTNRNLLGGLYRENPVKSRNYEAVKSSKKWENVGNSYIIPALLLYRYSYI